MVMANNLMTFGDNYPKLSLNHPPGIVYALTHISLATHNYSRLAWDLDLRERD